MYKQVMGCTYRDLESMTGIDYSTFIKFKKRLKDALWLKNIFEVLSSLIAHDLTSIIALIDSTFVQTYSRRNEYGSEYFGYKEKNGFKLHQMIDFETRLPLLQFATGGARSDIVWGGNLIRAAPWFWRMKAIAADKGYDGANFVMDIVLKFPGIKVAIPLRRHKKNDSWFNRWMKGRERSHTTTLYNKRSQIERYFSRKKHVFHFGEERTRGLKNFEANAYFVSIMEILEYAAKPEIWVLIFTKLKSWGYIIFSPQA